MRKLAVGVVAVLVLHIGFTSYMARDRATLVEQRAKNTETLQSITPVVDARLPVYELASLWQEPEPVVESPREIHRAVRPSSEIGPTYAAARRTKTVRTPVYARHSAPADVSTRPLQNTTILIKAVPRMRTEYPQVSSTTVAAKDSGKDRKRSDDPLYFAVFKKPAGWLKSAASKIF
jgi:hypothetical protein